MGRPQDRFNGGGAEPPKHGYALKPGAGDRGPRGYHGRRGKGSSEGSSDGTSDVQQPRNRPSSGSSEADPATAGENEASAVRAKDEVFAEIRNFVDSNSALQMADFDYRVRQHLHALYGSGGRSRVHDALELVHKATMQKSREAVRNWPAYIRTLLKKFDSDLAVKDREARAHARIAAAGASPTSLPTTPTGKAPGPAAIDTDKEKEEEEMSEHMLVAAAIAAAIGGDIVDDEAWLKTAPAASAASAASSTSTTATPVSSPAPAEPAPPPPAQVPSTLPPPPPPLMPSTGPAPAPLNLQGAVAPQLPSPRQSLHPPAHPQQSQPQQPIRPPWLKELLQGKPPAGLPLQQPPRKELDPWAAPPPVQPSQQLFLGQDAMWEPSRPWVPDDACSFGGQHKVQLQPPPLLQQLWQQPSPQQQPYMPHAGGHGGNNKRGPLHHPPPGTGSGGPQNMVGSLPFQGHRSMAAGQGAASAPPPPGKLNFSLEAWAAWLQQNAPPSAVKAR